MAYANKIWEQKFCIRQSGSIKFDVGMVDVAEGEEGGENQAATHNRTLMEMIEDKFTARERLNRI